MSSTVQAQLSADIAAFQAAMQAAAASVNQFAAQTQTAAGNASSAFATMAGNVNNNLNRTNASFTQLNNNVTATHNAFNVLGMRANFVGRELHAIIDETVAGRWTQFSGTATNILGTMAQLNPVLTAQIGIVAALAAGVGYLAYQWIATANAVRHAEGEMLIVGQNGANAIGEINRTLTTATDKWGTWQGEARKIALALASLHGPAADFRDAIENAALAQARLTGGDAVKTVEEYVKRFNEGGKGALEFANSIQLLDGQVMKTGESLKQHVENLVKTGQDTQAMNAILALSKDRFVADAEALAKYNKEMSDYVKMSAAAGAEGQAALPPPPTRPTLTIQPGLDQQATQDQNAVDKLNESLNRRQQYTIDLKAAQDALNRVDKEANPAAYAAAQNAVAEAEQKVASTHTELERRQHEETLSRLQQDLAANQDFADRRVGIEKQIAEENTKYFGQYSDQARSAENQVTAAAREARDAELRLKLAQLEQKEIAVKNSAGAEIAIENEKLALLRQYGKEGTLEYQNELNRRQSLMVRAGNQATTAAEDALRAQQAAHKNDYTVQLQIEDQILAMLKAHYTEASVQYQKELIKRQELLNAQAAQEAAVARQQANTARDLERIQDEMINRAAAAQKKGGTFSLVELFGGSASDLSTYEEQMNQLVAAHQAAMDAIKTSQQEAADQGKLAVQKALDAELIENQSFASKVQQIQLQAAEATRKAWESVADGIASSMSSSLSGMITGTTTSTKAIQSITESLLNKVLDYSLKMALRWAADRVLELTTTTTTEAAKTAAVTAGTTARTAAEHTSLVGSILSWIGQQLASFLGLETGKTAASVAGNAARKGVDAAAATASIAAIQTTGRAEIGTEAAIAAAAAFADTAMLGPAGLAAAPGAASAAYAAVMTFGQGLASLDVGAWSIPKDMVAQVHKGEMVIPANFAEGLRGALGQLGATQTYGGQPLTLNYAPSIAAGGGPGALSPNQIASIMSMTSREMYSYIWNVTRNGATKLPGR